MAAYFVAVIEVGSEKINGIAGVKNKNGSIEVKAAVSADSSSFVERGMVYNLNQATACFTAIVRELEKILHTHIEKVYTGIGGQSLHTVRNSITRTLTLQTVISKEIVESIVEQNASSFHSEDWDLLDSISQEYKVGGFEKTDPVGIIDSQIEGHFLNVIARKEVKKNLEDSFRQANIPLAGIFISPLLVAQYLLTDNEKRTGCVLVEFQYDTTTVVVYQRNILRHLAVLPIGERNVVRDIANTFNVEDSEARSLFRKYGNAYYDDADLNNTNKVIAQADGSPIDRKEFNETVEARLQEIIANVWNQLSESRYNENQFRCGIVFTGSSCGVKNLDRAFQQYKKSEIKVRIQKVLPIPVTDLSHRIGDNVNAALSILLEGSDNCAGESLESDIFSHAETGKKPVVQPQPDPEEERRKLEAERREKEFQLAYEETGQLIEEKKYKDARKKIKELQEQYAQDTDKTELLKLRLTALMNAERSMPTWWDKIKQKAIEMGKTIIEPEDKEDEKDRNN